MHSINKKQFGVSSKEQATKKNIKAKNKKRINPNFYKRVWFERAGIMRTAFLYFNIYSLLYTVQAGELIKKCDEKIKE